MRVCAGKNRIVQVAGNGSRKLFEGELRETFLEWFAATCNVKLSAAKAGVAYQTVFRHRMKDPGFAEAWDRALAQGYARLEARLLEEAGGVPASTPLPARAERESPSPARGEGLVVRGDLDGPEVEETFDPQLALQLLREHPRRLPGSADKLKDFRPSVRAADNAEIAAALEKRLKSFSLRVSKEEGGTGEEAPLPNPSPAAGRGAAE